MTIHFMTNDEEFNKFMEACLEKDLEKVKKLFKPEYLYRELNNDFPLSHIVGYYDSENIAKFLLEQGADPNKYSFLPPLHSFISTESEQVYEFFRAEDDFTTDMIKLLIDFGADINLRDKEGDTPLDVAIDEFHEPAEELLRSLGAKTGQELEEENKPINERKSYAYLRFDREVRGEPLPYEKNSSTKRVINVDSPYWQKWELKIEDTDWIRKGKGYQKIIIEPKVEFKHFPEGKYNLQLIYPEDIKIIKNIYILKL